MRLLAATTAQQTVASTTTELLSRRRGNVSLNNYEFLHNFYSRVGNDDWSAAQLLAEILCVRDDDFRVLFSDGGRLSTSELNCILSYVASSRS